MKLTNGLILTILLISQACICHAGPLMALDFGGESLRVSIVKPSKTPISVVLNEASKRKTSASVAFVEGARILGDDAAALSIKHPEKVFTRIRDLLGKKADSTDVTSVLATNKLPYKVAAAANGRAGVEVESGTIYSAEELAASLIHLARDMTESASEGSAILDCVITVPAFWGPAQRQAMLDAAKIADINVMSLVNNHAAAALQYGIERDFKDKSSLVVFYDMGATSTVAALVKFSSFSILEGGSTKTYGQFEVLDVAWDASLGGEVLDLVLIDHFAAEFETQNPGLDPRQSPKALAKLRRGVKRTKEVLSANTFAPISVEELMSGKDFRSRIERVEFEKLAAEFLDRVPKPLTELLERNNLAVKQLDAVELLGGGSRVPAVKAALSAALGGRSLDMHLNADEAVVLGAGLFAANLSTTFKLRKFGMKDGITYPISVQLKQSEGKVSEATENFYKPRALLPRMKALPVRRLVPLPPDLEDDKLQIELSFNTSDPAVGLPPGAATPVLTVFEVSGIKEARKKHNDTGKLSLHFKADESGIISLERAESVLEVTEEYTVKIPTTSAPDLKSLDPELTKTLDPKILEMLKSKTKVTDLETLLKEMEKTKKQKEEGNGDNTTRTSNDSADPTLEDEVKQGDDKNTTTGKDNSTQTTTTPPPPPAAKEVVKTRKKVLKQSLEISSASTGLQALSKDAVKESKKVMSKLAREEQARKEASRLRNELEAYIISFGSRLSGDDEVESVTSEQQRSDFSEQLLKAEDWLYGDGENEQSADIFSTKLAELEDVGDAIDLRVREIKSLPKAQKNAEGFLKNIQETVDGWKSTKPWLNETEVDKLKTQITSFKDWLSSESGKQQALASHQKPVLLSSTIESRLEALRKPFNALKNKKKPKPPPAPKKAQNSTDSGDQEEENKARQEEDREKSAPEVETELEKESAADHSEL